MSWYWITLIVVCYVLLSAVTCIVFSRVMKTTDDILLLIGIFWPGVVMTLPIFGILHLLDKVIVKYGYKEE